MSKENRSAEGNQCSDSASPIAQVEELAQSGESGLPYVENERVNEFVKEIQSVRDSSEIDNELGKIASRGSEQAEKEQCGCRKHEGPTERRLQDCGTGRIGLYAEIYRCDKQARDAGEDAEQTKSKAPLRRTAFQCKRKQRSRREELELNKTVRPLAAEAMPAFPGIPGHHDIGADHQCQ